VSRFIDWLLHRHKPVLTGVYQGHGVITPHTIHVPLIVGAKVQPPGPLSTAPSALYITRGLWFVIVERDGVTWRAPSALPPFQSVASTLVFRRQAPLHRAIKAGAIVHHARRRQAPGEPP
jgi:hypothetical protein